MSQIDNERTKLPVNALDRASTACFTVGIATPIAGYLYNVGNFRSGVSFAVLLLGLGIWLSAVGVPHYLARHLARRVLKGLRP